MLENIPKDELIALIREFPDRSIQWLLETPENVRGLLLIADRELAKRINYGKLERLNQTFILDSFRKLEADMLFVAPFLNDSGTTEQEVLIYILIEHQSSVDPIMPFRILSYITQVWDKQRREWEKDNIPIHNWQFRPILPIVFYTGGQNWNKSLNMRQLIDLPLVLERFIPSHEILFLNLKDTPSEKLVTKDNPFGWILRIIQKEDAGEVEFGNELKLTVENLEKMMPEEQTSWEKFMFFLWAFITHRRNRDQHDRLFNVVQVNVEDKRRREEVEKMGKTMAQALIEEGIEIGRKISRDLIEESGKKGLQQGLEQGLEKGLEQGLQQGLKQGLEQGKIDGLRKAISLVLEIKFGTDGLALLEKIFKIESTEKLEAIMEALKISNRIEDIEKLL
jgi:hypothetical protein